MKIVTIIYVRDWFSNRFGTSSAQVDDAEFILRGKRIIAILPQSIHRAYNVKGLDSTVALRDKAIKEFCKTLL